MANKRKKSQAKPKTPYKAAIKPRPERFAGARKAAGYGLLAMAVLFCWAIYTDFASSKSWERLSLWIALELAVLLSLLFYWSLWTGRASLDHCDGFMEAVLVVILVPPLIFFWFWIALERGGGDLANRIAGRIESIEMRFERKVYDPDEECLRVSGVANGKSSAENFCLSAGSVSSWHDGDLPQHFRATLVVKHSRFGHHPYKLEQISRVLPATGLGAAARGG